MMRMVLYLATPLDGEFTRYGLVTIQGGRRFSNGGDSMSTPFHALDKRPIQPSNPSSYFASGETILQILPYPTFSHFRVRQV